MAFWRLSSLLLLVACAAAISHFSLLDQEFQSFKTQHNKQYKDQAEERYRFKLYRQNKMMIEEHNELYAKGEVSYALGVNRFTDMNEAERQPIHGFERKIFPDQLENDLDDIDLDDSDLDDSDLPESVDWRTKGAVTEVNDQGNCWAQYAFAPLGAFEGQMFLATGNLTSYSAQYVIDCSMLNMGCVAGFPTLVYNFIETYGGVFKTDEYRPFNGTAIYGFATHFSEAMAAGYKSFKKNDENALKKAVATYGPVSVSIGTPPHFFMYKGGVYECAYVDLLSYQLLVVGYGTDPEHGDYWIAKNSWGTDWGEDGYIRMGRNRENNCLIAAQAQLPLIHKK